MTFLHRFSRLTHPYIRIRANEVGFTHPEWPNVDRDACSNGCIVITIGPLFYTRLRSDCRD